MYSNLPHVQYKYPQRPFSLACRAEQTVSAPGPGKSEGTPGAAAGRGREQPARKVWGYAWAVQEDP